MKILAVDSGNTRLKWALHDGQSWTEKGAIPRDLAAEQGFLGGVWAPLAIDHAIVSNVAGEAVRLSIDQTFDKLNIASWSIRSSGAQCGVINRYRTPEQLGTDRWAAMIAAHNVETPDQQVLLPKIVIMAGTAVTIDALTEFGEFIGGVIIPGLELMPVALHRGTAGLPLAVGEYRMFPTTTIDAIATGAIEACIGAIIRMHTHLAKRTGITPLVVLSGGAGDILIPHLQMQSFPMLVSSDLVLDGLLTISTEFQSGKAAG
jgi:type III pantothenate kinase